MKFKIECLLNFSANITSFTLESNKTIISIFCDRNGLNLIINIESEVDIFSEVKKKGKHILLDMISQIFPSVNQSLLKFKYTDANVVMDTISVFDIIRIGIRRNDIVDDKDYINFERPFIIESFPPLRNTTNIDEVFTRDYIDAMTCYYTYNLDDCIRRAVTSLENYYSYLHIKGKTNYSPFKEGTFMAKFKEIIIQNDKFLFPENVANSMLKTIWLIYKMRNKIVHDKFRLEQSDRWICTRVIYALYNFYNNRINPNPEISKYMLRLNMQFSLIQTIVDNQNVIKDFTLAFSHEEFDGIVNRLSLSVPDIVSNGVFPEVD